MKKKKIQKIEELYGEEETLSSIFDSVRDGVVILDRTGKITRMSRSLVGIGGYTKEEIVNQRLKFLKMFTPQSLAKILTNFIRTIANNETLPYEVEGKTKAGKKLFLEISGTPLKTNDKIVGIVAILRDITERKKMDEEIKNKNAESEIFNRVAVGRELTIIELKNKIKVLEEKLKK